MWCCRLKESIWGNFCPRVRRPTGRQDYLAYGLMLLVKPTILQLIVHDAILNPV